MHAKPNESDLKELAYYLSGFKLCHKGYQLVLGISEASFNETTRDFRNCVREIKLPRSKNFTEKRLMAEVWMDDFFKRAGDKMPDTGALHLPSYLDNRNMYASMKAERREQGLDCIHYSTFCRILSSTFPHVKIPKVNRFTRCDYCTVLGDEKRKARDKEVRKYLDNLFTFHNDLQMSERKVYYKHREKAKASPEKYATIMQDGMDQAKLLLPRLTVIAHAYANARQLRTHLTGLLNHGRQPKGYFDLFQYPHDANLTINVLLLELQSMDYLPDTLYLQMDNCWRENKNQFVLHFLAILVKLDIFKKVRVNFLMVGHTHEDVDQLFNRLAEYIVKRDTRCLSELMNSLQECYTPKPLSVMIKIVYDMKKWMAEYSLALHNISNPHAFKITKAPSGNAVLQYKNWASDKSEQWKPECVNQEEWITILKEDAVIDAANVPDLVAPNLDKVDLDCLNKDIKKYFQGSRLFSSEVREEWTTLLEPCNELWNVQEKPEIWPLQNLLIIKERQRNTTQNNQQASCGFLGECPLGVPRDIDEMVMRQVDPIPQIYTGPYKRRQNISEVDNCDVESGSLVAVNLTGYKPPNIAKVMEVMKDTLKIQWLKGSYRGKWSVWPEWPLGEIPKESVLLYGFHLEDDKLLKDTARFLRSRYKDFKTIPS